MPISSQKTVICIIVIAVALLDYRLFTHPTTVFKKLEVNKLDEQPRNTASSNNSSISLATTFVSVWSNAWQPPSVVRDNWIQLNDDLAGDKLAVACYSHAGPECSTNLLGSDSLTKLFQSRNIQESKIFKSLGDWYADHLLVKLKTGRAWPHILQNAIVIATLANSPNSTAVNYLNGEVDMSVVLEAQQMKSLRELVDRPKAQCYVAKAPNGSKSWAQDEIQNNASMQIVFAKGLSPVQLADMADDLMKEKLFRHCHVLATNPFLPLVELSWLKYDFAVQQLNQRVRVTGCANVGDEVQILAALQWLPWVDHRIERDDMTHFPGNHDKPTVIFLNAWYGGRLKWPPHPSIKAIPVAIHTEGGATQSMLHKSAYLSTEHYPLVGARDLPTAREMLKSQQNIRPTVSGCMTLTLENRWHIEGSAERSAYIAVDISKEDLESALPPKLATDLMKKFVFLTHHFPANSTVTDEDWRFHTAHIYLKKYATARVVVTNRIHVALPCVAFGTPVVFLKSKHLPQGNSEERLWGLTDLFHTYHLKTLNGGPIEDFDWVSPPANPNAGLFRSYRQKLQSITLGNLQEFEYSKKLYGLLPDNKISWTETPVVPSNVSSESTTSTSSNSSTFSSLGGVKPVVGHILLTRGELSVSRRTPMIAIESWCHHQPHSEVWLWTKGSVIMSQEALAQLGNKLPCRIKHFTMDLRTLLQSTPLEAFLDGAHPSIKNQTQLESGPYWYSHESDFFRLAALWKFGGWYIDHDIVFLKPISEAWRNAVAEERPNFLNNAASHFDSFHPFLHIAMEKLFRSYNPGVWISAGPELVTDVYRSFGKGERLLEAIGLDAESHGPFGTFGRVRKIPQGAMMAIPYGRSGDLFDPKKSQEVGAAVENSFAMHFWNQVSNARAFRCGSFLHTAYRKRCSLCLVECKA